MPATAAVPPAAVDTVVRADGEQIEMPREPTDGGDRRSRSAWRCDTALNVEEARPTTRLVPPVAHGATVVSDREHIEMFWITRHYRDWRASAGLECRERADAVPNHLAADPAEGHAERTHLAVVLGTEAAAVVVVRAFEQTHGSRRHGARSRVDRVARRIAHRGNGCRCSNGPSPLQRVPVGVGGDVRLGRLACRMMIVARLGAAGVVRIFIRKSKRRMSHLVNADLGGADSERVGAHTAATATIDRGVDDDDYHRELGHLRSRYRQRGGVVADQQSTDVVTTER